MLLRSTTVTALLLAAAILNDSAMGNLRFRVDDEVYGGVRLVYPAAGFDFSPFAAVEVVFDELTLNGGFLVVEPNWIRPTFVSYLVRTTTLDGPQVISVPIPSNTASFPPDAFAVNFGSPDVFTDLAASNVSGSVAEIRLKPKDPQADVRLIDDFSGPYFSASRTTQGTDGSIRFNTGEDYLKQVGIAPTHVLGGERRTLAFIRKIENPGVDEIFYEIDGDGTGSVPVVPEPSSIFIWVSLGLAVAGLQLRRLRIVR